MYEVFWEAFHPDVCLYKKGKKIFLHLRRAYSVLSTYAIDDMNNLTTSSLPAHCTLTPLNALPQHGSTAATVCSPARS